ncbi:MAG: hypothetical protein HQL22_08000 [Candidatus Omnitrophica bacterium]|nr:hypothetical protein [Candidatus Omnitrophota bacterium]
MSDKQEYNICRIFRFRYLWAGLWRALVFRKKVVFYYFIPGRASCWWVERLGFLSRRLKGQLDVLKCPHDVLEMVDARGSSVAMGAAYGGLDRFIDAFNAAYLDRDGALFGKLNARLAGIKEGLRVWINYYVFLDVYDPVLLVSIAEWLCGNASSALYGKDVRVIIDWNNEWVGLLRSCVSDSRVTLVFFNTGRPFREGILANTVYQFLNICCSRWRSLFRKEQLSKVATVCSFNEGFANLSDFDQRRNYPLFWFPSSGISPERISLFSHDSMRLPGEEVKKVSAIGFELVSCDGFLKKSNPLIKRYACSGRVLKDFAGYLIESFRLRGLVKSRVDYRLWHCLTILCLRLPFWEDYFRCKNVKVLFKPGSLMTYLDLAARLSDVAIISYQTSNFSKTLSAHAENCHVFFVWGKEYEMAYRTTYSRVGSFVHSGYVFDYVFGPLKTQAPQLRRELFGDKVRFVISLYDENWDAMNFISLVGVKKEMFTIYNRFFSYALQNTDVGIIIKPKKPANEKMLRGSPATSQAVQVLEQEGRLKFFDYRKYPSEAGVVSDLAVGLYSDSTAAFECCLAGTRAIYYDVMKSRELNPLYLKARNKIVFDDMGAMMAWIDQYRQSGTVVGRDDHLSDGIAGRDAFRDGVARERIGAYMGRLLAGLDQGLAKEAAIDRANASFAAAYGTDKVSRLKP